MPQAPAPEIPVTAPAAERESLYEKYELRSVEGARWTRDDGAYDFAALEEVAQQFPEANAVYEKSKRGPGGANALASVGGAVVGGTFGWNRAASSENEMSTGAQIALYSTGAALITVALVLAAVWENPAEHFADVYNAELRKSLGLPTAASSASEAGRSAWVPVASEQGFGWSF